MTKLILIKHSLPVIDPAKPAPEWQLGDEGLRRCAGLADALQTYLPAMLVSSYEPKAQATAAYLAQRWSCATTTHDGLEEHHRRSAPFQSNDDFRATVRAFFEQPDQLVFGEESAAVAEARYTTAIEGLLNKYPTQNLMVASHGTVISLYASRYCGLEPFALWEKLGLPSFLVIDRDTHTLEQVVMNLGD